MFIKSFPTRQKLHKSSIIRTSWFSAAGSDSHKHATRGTTSIIRRNVTLRQYALGVKWQQNIASRDFLSLGFGLGQRNSPVIISSYCFMLGLFVVTPWRSGLAFGRHLVQHSAATPAVKIEAYRGFTRYCHVNGWLVTRLGHTRSLPNPLHSRELRSSVLSCSKQWPIPYRPFVSVILENETDRLSRNVGKELPLLSA